jgi:hypothetical protein
MTAVNVTKTLDACPAREDEHFHEANDLLWSPVSLIGAERIKLRSIVALDLRGMQ